MSGRRGHHLSLVHSTDSPGYPEGVVCLTCSAYFGLTFKPKVTILPQRAMRQPDGRIALRDPVIICAQCQARGVETILS